ncbi:MAG: TonB-dependent receptor, partial [Calditrichaeota bacterium]|nr:TonB-dependent receptor [Calditrichota bacterium]
MRYLITVFLLTTLFAQQSGSISGYVSDKSTKEKLVGVNISVIDSQNGSTTDENGFFRIENLRAAAYKLKFEYLGYQVYIQPDIIVKPARETELTVQLVEDVFSGEAVEVTASFYESALIEPIRVVSFSPEEIRRSPGAGGELSRILGAMPSVATRGEDSQDIIVRGGSPLENFFMIDNIPVPSIRHFESATGHSNGPIGLINTALVHDVKFSAGGFGAQYGGYLSSVTDIEYREGNRESLNGEFGLDFTGFNGIIEGPFDQKNGSFFISARRSYLDVIADAIGESGAPRFEDVQGKVVYNINDNSKLILLKKKKKSAYDG